MTVMTVVNAIELSQKDEYVFIVSPYVSPFPKFKLWKRLRISTYPFTKKIIRPGFMKIKIVYLSPQWFPEVKFGMKRESCENHEQFPLL